MFVLSSAVHWMRSLFTHCFDWLIVIALESCHVWLGVKNNISKPKIHFIRLINQLRLCCDSIQTKIIYIFFLANLFLAHIHHMK